jgi:hypothetical protein
MLRNLSIAGLLVLSTALAAAADPKSDVQAAAKKLADSPNYSWTMTTEGGFGAGTSEGKTQKDGLTMYTLRMRDNEIPIVFKGEKGAMKLEDGWKSVAEAAQEGDPGQFSPGRFVARLVQNFRAPATLADDLAGKSPDLAKSEDGYAGKLSDDAAKELMTFGRRRGADANQGPQVKEAKATVKFWAKDGVLSKMQYHVEGVINFNGDDRDVDRTTTIDIKDVGSTKLDVPAEAKAKAGL